MIDSHCHLNDERYDDDVDRIVSDFAADDLYAAVVVGYDLPSSVKAVEMAEKYERIYATAGVHPSDCAGLSDDEVQKILTLCAKDKTVAFGEIGLDYFYDGVDRDTQKRALNRQLEAAKQSGVPVMFHLRDAYGDMDEILKTHIGGLHNGGVMHCFSGSKETAKKYVDMGFYISFSGSITFKNATSFPDIIKAVPIDRIMIETDCPYLTPVPLRGRTNYPAYVKYQAARIAEILGKTEEEVREITQRNTMTVYTKIK